MDRDSVGSIPPMDTLQSSNKDKFQNGSEPGNSMRRFKEMSSKKAKVFADETSQAHPLRISAAIRQDVTTPTAIEEKAEDQ